MQLMPLEVAEILRKFMVNLSMVKVSIAFLATEKEFASTFVWQIQVTAFNLAQQMW